jgi:hypothetical protein
LIATSADSGYANVLGFVRSAALVRFVKSFIVSIVAV